MRQVYPWRIDSGRGLARAHPVIARWIRTEARADEPVPLGVIGIAALISGGFAVLFSGAWARASFGGTWSPSHEGLLPAYIAIVILHLSASVFDGHGASS